MTLKGDKLLYSKAKGTVALVGNAQALQEGRSVKSETLLYDVTSRRIEAQGRPQLVFTPSKGLVGVGLPRTARKADLKAGIVYAVDSPQWSGGSGQDLTIGWDDIKHLTAGIVSKTFQDDTLPGGPREKTITYQAPFFKPDREEDYRNAWDFFRNK